MTQSDDESAATLEDLCFVIAPVGPPDTDIRKHADQLFTYLIEPAARECGFSRVERADQIQGSGNISSEIVTRLSEAKIVVADLSMSNPNVYYELVIRHIFRLPFVHMIREGDELPFDLTQNRAIRFDLGDLDSAHAAREQLQKAIEAEVSKGPGAVETPFTIALDLQALSTQQNAGDDSALPELARVVSRIESQQRDLLMQMQDISRAGRAPGPRWLRHRLGGLDPVEREHRFVELTSARERKAAIVDERTRLYDRIGRAPASSIDPSSFESDALRLESELAEASREVDRLESEFREF